MIADAELRLEVLHETLLPVREPLAPGGQVPALDDEAGHDAVERDAVVDPGGGQTQEVADVVRGPVRVRIDRDAAVGRVENHALGRELGVRLLRERRHLGRQAVAERDRPDGDAAGRSALGVDGRLTDIPFLSAWGKPLLLGPGSVHVAHTADEHVAIDELVRAVDLYAKLARELLADDG